MRRLPGFWAALAGLLTVFLVGRVQGGPVDLPPGENPEVVIPAATHPVAREPHDGLVQFHDLENGLSVLVEPTRGIPSVAVQLWIQAGAVHEGPAERGASVVVEQLLRLRCEDLLMRGSPALQAAAASVEVHAGLDATSIAIEAPSSLLEAVLRAMAMAVRPTHIAPGEFEQAHTMATERVRHLRTDGDEVAAAALAGLAFRVHPYRNLPVHQGPSLESRTREDVLDFMRREYVPQRASLVVVGKADKAEAARAIIQEFGTWEAAPPPALPKLVEPKLLSPRVGTQVGPDDARRLWIGFVAPPYRDHDAAGMAVLAELLDPASRTAASRRLLQVMPEGAQLRVHYVPARDPSLLTLRITGGTYDQEALVQDCLGVLRQITERGVHLGDLELAKQRLRNLALARTQGYADQARALGLSRILSAPEPPRPLLERVMALTPSHLQALAREYLVPSSLVAALLLPRSEQVTPPGDAMPAPEVLPLASGAQVLRAREGPRGPSSAELRLRLSGLAVADGEVGLLREGLLGNFLRSSSQGGWMLESPLPGLDRDALAFRITAAPEEFPRALTYLLRTLAEADPTVAAPPSEVEGETLFDRILDRSVDQALSMLLGPRAYGARRYPGGPGSPAATPNLRRLHRELFVPERMVLALSTGTDAEQARQALDLAFPAPSPSPPTSAPAPDTESAPPSGPASAAENLPGGDAVVVFAARVAGPGDELFDGARLLAEVLGSGAGSRLGRRLRKVRGLGFRAGSRYVPLEGGPGVLVAWIGCSRRNSELAELILREEVARLTQEPVATEELLAARERLRQDRLMDLQSTRLLVATLAARGQRELLRTQEPGLVDSLTLMELARTSFDDARIEAFPGRLASRPADPAEE